MYIALVWPLTVRLNVLPRVQKQYRDLGVPLGVGRHTPISSRLSEDTASMSNAERSRTLHKPRRTILKGSQLGREGESCSNT